MFRGKICFTRIITKYIFKMNFFLPSFRVNFFFCFLWGKKIQLTLEQLERAVARLKIQILLIAGPPYIWVLL